MDVSACFLNCSTSILLHVFYTCVTFARFYISDHATWNILFLCFRKAVTLCYDGSCQACVDTTLSSKVKNVDLLYD